MRPALSHIPVPMPTSWQQLPWGEWLLQQVAAGLDPWWPKLFGYHMVKLGPLATSLNASLSPIRHQLVISADAGDAYAELEALPIRCRTVDACVLPLVLDFHQDPHQVLREADRILVEGGHMVIVSYNPLSPLALGLASPTHRSKPPWNGRLFTPNRVKDWLGLLGYQVVGEEPLAFSSFLWSPDKFVWPQQMLHQYLPASGSVYMLVARKLAAPLTPAKPLWRPRKRLVVAPAALGRGAAKQHRQTESG